MAANINHYWCLDETGIWENTVVSRSYALMGENGTSVSTVGHGKCDTVIATLYDDGFRLPLYYLTHRRECTKKKVVSLWSL